jgi:hypothetical protein
MSSKNRDREFTPSGKGFQLSNTVFTKTKILNQISTRNQDQCLFFKTVLNMKESGTLHLTNVMEEDIKFGPTEVFMRDIGKKIKPMEEEG